MGNLLAVGSWQADKCKTAKMKLMEKGILIIIKIRMGKVAYLVMVGHFSIHG